MIIEQLKVLVHQDLDVLTLSVSKIGCSPYKQAQWPMIIQDDDILDEYVQRCLDVGVRDIYFTMNCKTQDDTTIKADYLYKTAGELNKLAAEMIKLD